MATNPDDKSEQVAIDAAMLTQGSHQLTLAIIGAIVVLLVVVGRNAFDAMQHHRRVRAIACDTSTFDAGTIATGEVLEHWFSAANTGDETVRVERVIESCGCLTVMGSFDGVEIAPGENLDVPIQIKASRSQIGPMSQRIVLQFGGAPTLAMTLTVNAEVVPAWRWSRESISFVTTSPSDIKAEVVELIRHPSAPAALPAISVSPSGLFSVSVEDTSELTQRVTVSTSAGIPLGRHQAIVIATLNDDAATEQIPYLRIVGVRE